FSGGIGDDGRFLLHGPETWYYPEGTTQHQADYDKGRKVGTETYWSRDGRKIWTWEHNQDGSSMWTQYWPKGRKKAESTWKDFSCNGMSTVWDRDGDVISSFEFANGKNTAEMLITDTLVIGSTENITAAANSTLNGPGATITVNGGSFTVNGRFNLGADNDGYIYLNGGTFTVKGLFTFPDGPGGVHRIYLNDGIMHAGSIEQKHERDAIIYVGGGILRLDDISDDDGDPHEWKDNGDLLPAEGYDDIVIEDRGDYTEVRAVKYPPTIQSI
ncbi:MAG: toxin-antitoxin system YwqK family antitoxin, partial [Planctomycetota bacterium]